MVVGKNGAESSVDNAFSMANNYWLSRQEAVDEAKSVAQVVDSWRIHFKSAELGANAIEALSTYIDRPALIEQRRALLR
jgi:serine/threonine-protein kinase HipA